MFFLTSKKKLLVCFVTLFLCSLVLVCCSSKKQIESINSKQDISGNIKFENKAIDKEVIFGTWGISPEENASFQIQGDTIYYPDANRRLKYSVVNNSFVCFDENGDTNFSCTIKKLDKDSFVMEDNTTKEKTAFIRIP